MVSLDDILEFFSNVDKILQDENKKLTIITIGGTALELYGFKDFSKDIDIMIDDIKPGDIGLMKKIKQEAIRERVELHIELYGQIIRWTLPNDYGNISSQVEATEHFKNLQLKVLDLYDIIITKCERYDMNDQDDIKRILENEQIDSTKLQNRFDEMIPLYKGYPTQRSLVKENFKEVTAILKETNRK